ncbi:MAG: hypothetical protein IRY91_15825 [Gemmatimonadaceae bacterium]|nr:hypothetical protein [Gemmatimonadaceae bacterium]
MTVRRSISRRTAPPLDRTLIALALLLAIGCGGEGARADATHRTADATRSARAMRYPYRVVPIPRSSAIVGLVTVGDDTPRDSVVPVTVDQTVCGPTARVPLVERRGTRVEGAVAWLDDLRQGKALPIDRRYEVTMDRCAIEPHVQAAIAGGMLNVRSDDPAVHRIRFTRDGVVVDHVQETDAGQVVPTEKVLAQPGLVEARCELHAWASAWIQVFDHPYFAVTNRDGTFTIDSVPPGTYHLVVWQPHLGRREREVRVDGVHDSRIEIRY